MLRAYGRANVAGPALQAVSITYHSYQCGPGFVISLRKCPDPLRSAKFRCEISHCEILTKVNFAANFATEGLSGR